jgi:hypothetical protein
MYKVWSIIYNIYVIRREINKNIICILKLNKEEKEMMMVDGKKIRRLYVATTKDKYELPIAVADSVAELAEMLDMRPETISFYISLGRPGFYRVEV